MSIYFYTAISKCQPLQVVKSKLWHPPPALPLILFAVLYIFTLKSTHHATSWARLEMCLPFPLQPLIARVNREIKCWGNGRSVRFEEGSKCGGGEMVGNHRAIVWMENCPSPGKINSPLKRVSDYSDLKLWGPWIKAIRRTHVWRSALRSELVQAAGLFSDRAEKGAKITRKTSITAMPYKASLCPIASRNSLPYSSHLKPVWSQRRWKYQ